MTTLISSVSEDVPSARGELSRLGRTLKQRAGDVLAYFDRARHQRRPGLAACLKSLRDGDTLVVWKLDRLGMSLHHLVNTVHDLTGLGIGLKVLTGQGAAIDTTTTPAGRLVFGSSPRWLNTSAL